MLIKGRGIVALRVRSELFEKFVQRRLSREHNRIVPTASSRYEGETRGGEEGTDGTDGDGIREDTKQPNAKAGPSTPLILHQSPERAINDVTTDESEPPPVFFEPQSLGVSQSLLGWMN